MRGLIAVVPFVAGCDVLFQLRHLDPAPSEPPAVVSSASDSCIACSSHTLSFTALDGRASNLLLVSVAVSGNGSSPAVVAASYGGTPLSFVVRGFATSTSSQPLVEQWQLLDPPPGMAPLTVTLGATAAAIVVGVAQIEGARDVEPVRASATAGSQSDGQAADGTVESQGLDLVIDSVCGGSSVDAPAPAQIVLYVRNVSDAFACANLGASTTAGAPPSVALHWGVNGNFADNWVHVASSIAPGL